MKKPFFFGVLALLLVQAPFILAEDLCENVSRSYEDLCEEIIDLDLDRDDTIDLIENIDEQDYYEPIPESRFEWDYCNAHQCLIPTDLDGEIEVNGMSD